MSRKAISGIMVLTILLISTLTLAFNIQTVKSEWTGTVYIRADGSIYPPGAPIITYDKITYTLTDNITSSGDGIVVERDNIVIDGACYTIQGTGAYPSKGIDLSRRTNVTVMNTQIKNFYYGFYLYYYSYNNIMSQNHITNNLYGVWLVYSSGNIISGNNIINNEIGIGLDYSSNNSVSGNNIMANNMYGVWVDSSSNNSISGNTFTNDGLFVWDSYHNVVVGNTVNGKPLVYLEAVIDYSVFDAGQVILVNCSGIKAENLNISGIDIGVQLWQTNNSIISGNNITNNCCGIWLGSSSNNIISQNYITKNGWGISLRYSSNYNSINGNNITYNQYGVYVDYSSNNNIISQNIITKNENGVFLRDSSNYNSISGNELANNVYGISLWDSSNYNSISGNNITNNSEDGIRFGGYSSNNSISGNNITNNWCGICLGSSSNNIISQNNITNNYYGFWVSSSSNNSISGNNIIANNRYGIWFDHSSNYNSISGNNITYNDCGVKLEYSSNNCFYHNNFINNMRQVLNYADSSTNVWDYGYPSGGNYWSDYAGVDNNGDGIGDAPYVIDENNVDRYPLMNPWGSGTPVASFTWIPSVPEVGGVVTFDASASMPIGGEIVSYAWDFGDGSRATGKIVTHAYSSAGTFTVTLNVTDSEGLWDIEQRQIEVKAPPPPLTVSISPLSASILVGQSITFTSTVSGGYTPYSYQWYLNGNPVSGATSPTWTFTPTTSGIYYVYLKVTDNKGNTAQSDTARITVASVPVGGYSIPIKVNIKAEPTTPYIALIATLTAAFITIKRKTKRKH